ncbi:MAG TPA: T9SS type A sorting domain-containing protein [Chitinophagales bacterium]|nr:T9SS type A sorting domain-containing protein [Chitinophagales bacterium]
MKFYHLLAAFALMACGASAQISVGQSDLPQAGQTFLMSNGNPMNIAAADLAVTGANQTWNFDLQSTSLQTDTILEMSDVPFAYQLTFFSSDFALNNATPDFTLPIPGFSFSVSDVYDFFNRTSTKMEQTGFGANINGLTVPVPFNPRDIVYELPLAFGDSFSGNAAFSLPIPTLGSWSQQRERVSSVDGWGMLQGPLGNQQVLRVKSEVTYNDSIYVDLVGFGFNVPRQQIEYKWLTTNGGVPILQVTTNVIFGNEVVSAVRYRDAPTGLEQTLATNQSMVLYPQPASNLVTIVNPFVNEVGTNAVVTDCTGRVVMSTAVENDALIDVNVNALPDGLYLLTLRSGNASFTRRLAVVR